MSTEKLNYITWYYMIWHDIACSRCYIILEIEFKVNKLLRSQGSFSNNSIRSRYTFFYPMILFSYGKVPPMLININKLHKHTRQGYNWHGNHPTCAQYDLLCRYACSFRGRSNIHHRFELGIGNEDHTHFITKSITGLWWPTDIYGFQSFIWFENFPSSAAVISD